MDISDTSHTPEQDTSALLQMTSVDGPEWLSANLTVAYQYEAIYRRTGVMSDLNAAIVQFKSILDNTHESHSERSDWHVALGNLYYDLYEKTETAVSLDLATQHLEESLDKTPEGHPDVRSRIRRTAYVYKTKCITMSREEDVETCLQLSQKALDLTAPDNAHHAGCSWDLGEAYYVKYQMTKQLGDLDRACSLCQRAMEMMLQAPKKNEEEAKELGFLAHSYWLKFEITNRLTDLDASIRWREKAVEFIKEIRGPTSEYMTERRLLFELYRIRCRITAATSDVDKSIQLCKDALDLTHDRQGQSSLLEVMGECHEYIYHETGAVTDIVVSIRYKEEALARASDDPHARAERLSSLARSRISNPRMTTDLAVVESTIRDLQEAISLTPAGHHQRSLYTQYLGTCLWHRNTLTGAMVDLDVSIQQFTELCSTSPEDDSLHWIYLNLQAAYHSRYLQTRDPSDIQLAIEWCRKALGALPDGDEEAHADCLMELATCYNERYDQTGLPSDLEVAAQYCQQAVQTVPETHPSHAVVSARAGDIHLKRFTKTKAVSDSDVCILLYQKALHLTSEDHRRRPWHLWHLGSAYEEKYAVTASDTDAKLSVDYLNQALELTSDDHPDRVMFLGSLCALHLHMHRVTGLAEYANVSIQGGLDALDHPSSLVALRLIYGTRLFLLFCQSKNWDAAHQMAAKVLHLITQYTPRSLGNSDKQYQLERASMAGFTSEAVAVTLLAGKSAFQAVQLLELGRGIIIGSLGELRTDISALQREYPVLAKDYINLRNQLDTPIVPDISINRHSLAKEFDEILREIRKQPNFERFLLPTDEDELKAAAAWGPVIILNAHYYRCDAIIINKEKIQSLHLPRLDYLDIESYAAQFSVSSVQDTGLFEWLWDTIAHPILSFLHLDDTPKENWPRIWWIPTGPLVKLPIHAAGRHDDGSHNTVLDRAISSYSSSVKTLLQSRQTSSTAEQHGLTDKAVLVGMETTPGLGSLPSVRHEIARVASLCDEMQIPCVKPPTRRQQVLSEMRSCSIFHFAGHGRNNASDPSKSALLLSDGPVTVAALFDINIHAQKPFLAYLSACGTGQVRHDGSVDEGLHLISACQTAGFRHVIGSLCAVEDTVCQEFASQVYLWIKTHGMNDRSICEGLHHASRKLRDEWVASGSAIRNARRREKELSAKTDPESLRLGDSSVASGGTKDLRDVVLCEDDIPAHWAPYVHFGA